MNEEQLWEYFSAVEVLLEDDEDRQALLEEGE